MSLPQVKFYNTTYDPSTNALANGNDVVDGGIVKASCETEGLADPRLYIKNGNSFMTVGQSLQECHINTLSSYNDGVDTHKEEWAITDHIEGTSSLHDSSLFYKVFINKDATATSDPIFELQKHEKINSDWNSTSLFSIAANGDFYNAGIIKNVKDYGTSSGATINRGAIQLKNASGIGTADSE